MKRVFVCFILIICILLSSFIACGRRDNPTNGLVYEMIEGKNEYALKSNSNTAQENITIASTYNGLPVTKIDGLAFYNDTNMASVYIPETITSINTGAFMGCVNLKSISIPKNVNYIADTAFLNCSNLKEITVNKDNQFYTSIDGNLYNKDGSSLIRYASGKRDERFMIPISVKKIEVNAINDSDYLKEIEMSNCITSIGDGALFGCDALKNITIPHSVKSIGRNAFASCNRLEQIFVEESNLNYISIDGNLYNKRKTHLIQYCIKKNNEKFEVPQSVEKVETYAFVGASSLKTIIFSNNVLEIGSFEDCENLVGLKIPNTITVIASGQFRNCKKLEYLIVPKSITFIAPEAFYGCDKLKLYVESSQDDNAPWELNYPNISVYYYSETSSNQIGQYWHYDSNGEIEIWS